jgi:hypothetical protein
LAIAWHALGGTRGNPRFSKINVNKCCKVQKPCYTGDAGA